MHTRDLVWISANKELQELLESLSLMEKSMYKEFLQIIKGEINSLTIRLGFLKKKDSK